MFLCGDDAGAKASVSGLVTALGWEPMDSGTPVAARAIEPLCMLWCIPRMRGGSWTHAFKLLRPAQHFDVRSGERIHMTPLT